MTLTDKQSHPPTQKTSTNLQTNRVLDFFLFLLLWNLIYRIQNFFFLLTQIIESLLFSLVLFRLSIPFPFHHKSLSLRCAINGNQPSQHVSSRNFGQNRFFLSLDTHPESAHTPHKDTPTLTPEKSERKE